MKLNIEHEILEHKLRFYKLANGIMAFTIITGLVYVGYLFVTSII